MTIHTNHELCKIRTEYRHAMHTISICTVEYMDNVIPIHTYNMYVFIIFAYTNSAIGKISWLNLTSSLPPQGACDKFQSPCQA